MTSLLRSAISRRRRLFSISGGGGGRGSRLELDGLLLTVTQVPAERAGPHNRDEFIRSQSRDRKRRV